MRTRVQRKEHTPMMIENMKFETRRVRPGVFSYRVRAAGTSDWIEGSDFIHGRVRDRRTRQALIHFGRLDLSRARPSALAAPAA